MQLWLPDEDTQEPKRLTHLAYSATKPRIPKFYQCLPCTKLPKYRYGHLFYRRENQYLQVGINDTLPAFRQIPFIYYILLYVSLNDKHLSLIEKRTSSEVHVTHLHTWKSHMTYFAKHFWKFSIYHKYNYTNTFQHSCFLQICNKQC